MFTVNTVKEAWSKVNEIFPTDYIKDERASENAGYDIYRSESRYYCYICDLGTSLEINLDNGETIRIHIKDDGEKRLTCARANHYYSDTFCKDKHARTQDELQKIAAKIRKNCKVVEIVDGKDYACTIYENNNLGLKYWIKDEFGEITEIDEIRYS